MAVPYRVVWARMVVLLLGAYAQLVAVQPAIAQDFVTYEVKDRLGNAIVSLQSASGLAVVCTYYQPLEFDYSGVVGGSHYGRLVADGPPLTGTAAAVSGIYRPATELNPGAWLFGDVRPTYSFVVGGGDDGGFRYPNNNPTWPVNQLVPSTGLTPSSSSGMWPQWSGTSYSPPAGLAVSAPGYTSHKWVYSGGTELEFWASDDWDGKPYVYWVSTDGGNSWDLRSYDLASAPKSGGVPLPSQQDILHQVLSVQADPFKAGGDSPGSIDLTPVVDAIVAQHAMQDGYFSDWQLVYDELFEQLTGGASEMDWLSRDARRDGYLAEIRDLTTTSNLWLQSLYTLNSQIRTDVNNIRFNMTQLLSAVTPGQIPPQVSGPGSAVAEPVLSFEDVEAEFIDPLAGLPDDWVLPTLPETSPDPVYNFTIPLASFAGMDDIPVTVDLTPYDVHIQALRAFGTVFFAFAMCIMILNELRKS